MIKKLVVLTKSKKNKDFCIAGIDIEKGEWIRLVSANVSSGYAVPKEDLLYKDGNEVEIWDIIECQIIEHSPLNYQPENFQYNSEYYWKKIGIANVSDVLNLVPDKDPYIFFDNSKKLSGSYYAISKSLAYSLKLVQLENANLKVKKYEKMKHTLCFTYNNYQYNYINITDEAFKVNFPEEGEYELSNVLVVFSLGTLHSDGYHYKLVAHIENY